MSACRSADALATRRLQERRDAGGDRVGGVFVGTVAGAGEDEAVDRAGDAVVDGVELGEGAVGVIRAMEAPSLWPTSSGRAMPVSARRAGRARSASSCMYVTGRGRAAGGECP